MPTESWSNEYLDAHSKVSELNSRLRGWVRTQGFNSIPVPDRPINSYSDFQVKGTANSLDSIRVNNATGQPSVYRRIGFNPGTANFSAFMYLDSAPPHRSDASLLNETLLKALVKVSDAKTNLPVMFAEKAKTSSLIYDSASRIYRAMRHFRRGNFKGVADELNISPSKVHKTWLEYKYGWTPLLMDVKNSAEFFAQQISEQRLSEFSVSSNTVESISYEGLPTGGFNRMGFDANFETIRYWSEQEKSCRVKLWLKISNPQLSQLQQLGLTNPALVAWELVPFSFVFDWFISVGQYLQGITALHGVTILKAMQSYEEHVVGGSVESFPGYSGFYDNYLPWDGLLRDVYVRRYRRDPLVVNQSDLYPPSDFSLPSGERLISALALMRTNVRSFGNIRT